MRNKLALNRPEGLKITNEKRGKLLTWESDGKDVAGYEVEVRGKDRVELNFVKEPSFKLTKLEDGAEVRVRAVYSADVSDWVELDG